MTTVSQITLGNCGAAKIVVDATPKEFTGGGFMSVVLSANYIRSLRPDFPIRHAMIRGAEGTYTPLDATAPTVGSYAFPEGSVLSLAGIEACTLVAVGAAKFTGYSDQ